MPGWFINLAYIVFAAVMVVFLVGVAVFVISLSAACIREARRRNRRNESKRNDP